MRISTRYEFMRLPEGVLFCKGKPWAFDSLMVKGYTLTNAEGAPIDFTYRDLCGIEMGADSGEWAARMEEMHSSGASYPLNEDYGRDGCFDDEEVFLVYEDADVAAFRSAIDAAPPKDKTDDSQEHD